MAVGQSSKSDRVVTDIDLECFGFPLANCLNDVRGYLNFSKHSGTTSVHGVARDIRGEVLAKSSYEPATSGYTTILS